MSNTSSDKHASKGVIRKLSHIFSWNFVQKLIGLSIFSIIVNHLTPYENFPGNESYSFPLKAIITSITLGAAFLIIAHLNFEFYKQKYFSKQIELIAIIRYLLSTLAYITILYIPIYIIVNILNGGQPQFYYLLTGLLLTLLVVLVAIILFYAKDLYDLYQASIKEGQLTIEHGAKTTMLTYENIACFYSENKVVYAVQNDGTTITTDFTLNALEEMINDQLFFRANRQVIIHIDSIDQIEKIENGKLLVRLKPSIEKLEISNINISRYKRKAFMEWFE